MKPESVEKPLQNAESAGAELEIQISKKFGGQTGGESRVAFDIEADFALTRGITVLLGHSGAGKTAILNCIAGLIRPDRGRIALQAEVLFSSEENIDLPVEERGIGYVFQHLALFPYLTVWKNIAYGLERLSRDEQTRRVGAIAEAFRIRHTIEKRPGEISGGEKQRVALARALVTEPRALLLDEPLAAVDPGTKARIIDDLRDWNAAHRIPILYVTHNREEVFALGERVIALENGRIIAQGTPAEVVRAPRHVSLAEWSGLENRLEAQVVALHEDQGTMTCRAQGAGSGKQVDLEIPLGHSRVGEFVLVGIGAGDILVATRRPEALSARNVLQGKIASLRRRDVTVIAQVDCGVGFEVHLTPGAQEALQLGTGQDVWVVIKTYSCHLLNAGSGIAE